MSINHSEILNHQLHKPKTRSYAGMSIAEISETKRQDAKRRANELKDNQNVKEYFDWFFGIQYKLNLSDDEFARRLGLKSSRQLFHYRANSGHFPSKQTQKRARELEKLIDLKQDVVIKKLRVKVNG